jgi:hypothetical protein
MALQIEVTKAFVLVNEDGIYTVTAKLTCWPEGVVKEYPVVNPDGTVDLKNTIIYQSFSQNHNPANAISVARDALQDKMQTIINQYKQAKVVFDSPQLDNALSYIENNLEG